jgi:monovalent cation/proton antiporter MnhG/PhaG subunit
MSTALEIIAVALIAAGLLYMTVSVIGTLRWRSLPMQIHAAGKSVMLGMLLILIASIGTGDVVLIRRAFLVLLFLLITAPVSSHAIARAARDRDE